MPLVKHAVGVPCHAAVKHAGSVRTQKNEPMDINQLEVFLGVANEKSFSRAAEALHRTQPAVSQAVARVLAAAPRMSCYSRFVPPPNIALAARVFSLA